MLETSSFRGSMPTLLNFKFLWKSSTFQDDRPIIWDAFSNFSLSLLLTILEATLGFKALRGFDPSFHTMKIKSHDTICNLKEMKSSENVKTNCYKKISTGHFKCLKFKDLLKLIVMTVLLLIKP